MKRTILILVSAAIMTAPGTAIAQSATHDEIVAACLSSSNLPDPICSCMADKLLTDDYTDTQRQWYVLALTDTDAAEALVPDMSPTETMEIGMFSATGPGQCAAGG